MQWLYLITTLIVGFGIGHCVCWMGRSDSGAALAADKRAVPTAGPEYTVVETARYTALAMLYNKLRRNASYNPQETYECIQEQLNGASKRNGDYMALKRMLSMYVGCPPNPFKNAAPSLESLQQRHRFIQEQAAQCGYSTILYSLSPSSSIFTPNYVNGFQQFAQQPVPSCVETSTSSDCVLTSVRQSSGSSHTVCAAHPRTHCPSCHHPMLTNYTQKCVPCRQGLNPTR